VSQEEMDEYTTEVEMRRFLNNPMENPPPQPSESTQPSQTEEPQTQPKPSEEAPTVTVGEKTYTLQPLPSGMQVIPLVKDLPKEGEYYYSPELGEVYLKKTEQVTTETGEKLTSSWVEKVAELPKQPTQFGESQRPSTLTEFIISRTKNIPVVAQLGEFAAGVVGSVESIVKPEVPDVFEAGVGTVAKITTGQEGFQIGPVQLGQAKEAEYLVQHPAYTAGAVAGEVVTGVAIGKVVGFIGEGLVKAGEALKATEQPVLNVLGKVVSKIGEVLEPKAKIQYPSTLTETVEVTPGEQYGAKITSKLESETVKVPESKLAEMPEVLTKQKLGEGYQPIGFTGETIEAKYVGGELKSLERVEVQTVLRPTLATETPTVDVGLGLTKGVAPEQKIASITEKVATYNPTDILKAGTEPTVVGADITQKVVPEQGLLTRGTLERTGVKAFEEYTDVAENLAQGIIEERGRKPVLLGEEPLYPSSLKELTDVKHLEVRTGATAEITREFEPALWSGEKEVIKRQMDIYDIVATQPSKFEPTAAKEAAERTFKPMKPFDFTETTPKFETPDIGAPSGGVAQTVFKYEEVGKTLTTTFKGVQVAGDITQPLLAPRIRASEQLQTLEYQPSEDVSQRQMSAIRGTSLPSLGSIEGVKVGDLTATALEGTRDTTKSLGETLSQSVSNLSKTVEEMKVKQTSDLTSTVLGDLYEGQEERKTVYPDLGTVKPLEYREISFSGRQPTPSPIPILPEVVKPLPAQIIEPKLFEPTPPKQIEPMVIKPPPPKQIQPPIVTPITTPPKYGAPKLTPLEASFKPKAFTKPFIGAPLGSVFGVGKASKMSWFRFGKLEHPVADISRFLRVKVKGRGGGRRRRR